MTMIRLLYTCTVLFVVTLGVAGAHLVKRADYSIPSYGGGGGHGGGHGGGGGGGYGHEAAGYEDEDNDGLFGLSFLIIPALAILGFSLLFPTVVTINTGNRRRKRQNNDIDQLDDMVNRVHNIYLAVTESEECMDRVICELGGVMKNVSHKQTVFGLLSTFIPGNYKKYVKTLKDSAFSGDIRKCEKIKCNIIDDDSY